MRLIAVLRKIKPRPGEFFSFVLLFLILFLTLWKYFIFSIALSSVSDVKEGVLTGLWGCRIFFYEFVLGPIFSKKLSLGCRFCANRYKALRLLLKGKYVFYKVLLSFWSHCSLIIIYGSLIFGFSTGCVWLLVAGFLHNIQLSKINDEFI